MSTAFKLWNSDVNHIFGTHMLSMLALWCSAAIGDGLIPINLTTSVITTQSDNTTQARHLPAPCQLTLLCASVGGSLPG